MTNEQPMSRRNMLGAGVAGTLAIGSLTSRVLQAAPGKQPASERIQVGCIGAAGRAGSLIKSFCNSSQADLVAIADLDESRLAQGVKSAEDIQGHRPRAESDFRKLIDDPKLDVIVVGTPDHWHAIPTILACINGKDVYVEKPDGHNIVEGQRMVEAMRKHERIVQMGSQHRSTERMKSALEFIATGALGRVLTAKAWESTRQGNIGYPPDGNPPEGVDYEMWLGAAQAAVQPEPVSRSLAMVLRLRHRRPRQRWRAPARHGTRHAQPGTQSTERTDGRTPAQSRCHWRQVVLR
ncbi:MAG: Gfo/Idh/MocA family oxidoreductase [Planctomycetaceae bacterium]